MLNAKAMYQQFTLLPREKKVSCSILLKDIEEKVNGYGFFRINRNTLVNLKYFDSFVSGKERCFKTITGMEMSVSKRKWSILKENIEV
jgi:DNA-binding LytR/AlgR family response regulator